MREDVSASDINNHARAMRPLGRAIIYLRDLLKEFQDEKQSECPHQDAQESARPSLLHLQAVVHHILAPQGSREDPSDGEELQMWAARLWEIIHSSVLVQEASSLPQRHQEPSVRRLPKKLFPNLSPSRASKNTLGRAKTRLRCLQQSLPKTWYAEDSPKDSYELNKSFASR